jgi:hypothetical protein
VQETACKIIRRFLTKREAGKVRNVFDKLKKINGGSNPLRGLVAIHAKIQKKQAICSLRLHKNEQEQVQLRRVFATVSMMKILSQVHFRVGT